MEPGLPVPERQPWSLQKSSPSLKPRQPFPLGHRRRWHGWKGRSERRWKKLQRLFYGRDLGGELESQGRISGRLDCSRRMSVFGDADSIVALVRRPVRQGGSQRETRHGRSRRRRYCEKKRPRHRLDTRDHARLKPHCIRIHPTRKYVLHCLRKRQRCTRCSERRPSCPLNLENLHRYHC